MRCPDCHVINKTSARQCACCGRVFATGQVEVVGSVPPIRRGGLFSGAGGISLGIKFFIGGIVAMILGVVLIVDPNLSGSAEGGPPVSLTDRLTGFVTLLVGFVLFAWWPAEAYLYRRKLQRNLRNQLPPSDPTKDHAAN